MDGSRVRIFIARSFIWNGERLGDKAGYGTPAGFSSLRQYELGQVQRVHLSPSGAPRENNAENIDDGGDKPAREFAGKWSAPKGRKAGFGSGA
jgi:hypothetical protein